MTSTDPLTEPELTAPELLADPYAGFDRIREQAPLVRGRYLDGSPMWLVTRYADVQALLADPRFVNNPANLSGEPRDNPRQRMMELLGMPDEFAPYFLDTILSSDGATHSRLRKLVSRAFTVRRVAGLRPSVERIVAELLDELAAEAPGPVDLVERFSYPLPITVISDLVGIEHSDRPRWRAWGRALISMDPDRFGPSVREMIDYLHELVEQRRARPADGLLDELIRMHDEDGDRLSDTELVTMVLTLVFAGHETTSHLLSNATVTLLGHPGQLALLRAEPARWAGAVHELMRFRGPVLFTSLRYAGQDMEFAGQALHAGDAMQPVLVAANRDPRQYLNPEQLDLNRRQDGHGEGHVGFGHGVHYCLGAALARQEAEVALRALFERFPDLSLAVPEAELPWVRVPGVRRLSALPLTLT